MINEIKKFLKIKRQKQNIKQLENLKHDPEKFYNYLVKNGLFESLIDGHEGYNDRLDK